MRDMQDIIDDIRTIYETIREMLAHRTSDCHVALIREMLKLNPLEQELQEITGDWDTMHRITMAIYKSVFSHVRAHKPTEP